jgi:hypothetical protein
MTTFIIVNGVRTELPFIKTKEDTLLFLNAINGNYIEEVNQGVHLTSGFVLDLKHIIITHAFTNVPIGPEPETP